ncbi:tryptophan--tRNA ligase [Natronobacterium gregoryi]|uniref:Tryptophan--tRNA ligase n=2 Tax=Natronobacterium gregoryi TaxID=44930 RepID=L0AHG5_NATGS|nr:tryptophan--tRNA ligase [Natronobacterium gregoryi]AFZ72587.1 tryptophanyl-tRNA synthetase [Natronobacterium gregoryi SP2]ELY71894.1 tryptophanyl-tRNA ligase [Natronobacterium gregoryi SP2]PLK19332.1 tryptophan--tRNA ligase [Natronobacterium gregoryi SP2]SFJ52566.1 tryptophanyl-tRNA synthetase [Natronobacterium gregoryi]
MTGDDPLEESESREPFADGGRPDADDEGASTPRADGGTVDEVALDPWGSSAVSDYRKLFEEFGIEEFDEVLEEVPNPHYLMRRGVIFGHRDYRSVAEAMHEDEPAAVLSGFMPTGDPHIGHKLVFDEIVWHQEQGADAYALIADLEANSARGMSWAEIDEHARSYLLSLLALGFDPEEGVLYRQSTNRDVQDLAFDLGAEANFSEFQSIYGFDGETDVSHMQSVVTQMADILYPQLEEPKPTVIPVGPDQDPHVRLARDLAERMRFFKVSKAYASFELEPDEREVVADCYERLEPAAFDDDQLRCTHVAKAIAETPLEELAIDASTLDDLLTKLEEGGMEPVRPRTRFFSRRATDDAFDALIDAIDGEKRVYESHVDAFEIDREKAKELAREVEVANGGYGFQPPSSIYHRFMTGLTGGKMSSSIPASHISLLDDPEDGYDKVQAATTGGRETAEEQREKGGKADECPVYELYAYLLAGDDDEFAKRVYDECVGGERLCGGCKEQAAQLMKEFLEDHQEKREEVEELLEEADIELESPRRR